MDVTTVEEWIEGKQLKSSEDGGVDPQISESQPSESRLTDSQLMSSKLAIAQSTKSKPSFLQCTNSKLTFLNRDSNMTENHTESHLPNSELANSQHTSSNPTDMQTTDMQTTDTQTTYSNLPLLQPDSNIAESQNTNSELAESVLSNTYLKFTNEQNIPRMEPDIMDSIQNTVSLSLSKDQNDLNNWLRNWRGEKMISCPTFLTLTMLFSIVMFANFDHCNSQKNDLLSHLFDFNNAIFNCYVCKF